METEFENQIVDGKQALTCNYWNMYEFWCRL